MESEEGVLMGISSFPFVSVVLPIYNEEDHIRQCLDSLLAQDYPQSHMEILVVDGRSKDRTRHIVREEFVRRHEHIQLLDNPHRIVPTALNVGIRAARGGVIVRVDGHTTVAPDYVSRCIQALERSGADNVGGRMDAEVDGYFGEAVALATSSPFGVGGARFHYSQKEEWVDTVYLGAYPRRVFEQIGLFDEEMVRNQDDEFNYRLRARGGRILLSPHIRSHYTCRDKPRKLWLQYFQYGYWKVRVLQKHPRQMRWRQFVPPVFLVALLGAVGLVVAGMLWPLMLVAGSYLLANLAASLWTASRAGLRYLPVLPLTYAILHFAYGAGFLSGLVRFAGRWQEDSLESVAFF
jgi:glycosyltransferase involved in cell wall biosynthesis